ncbi:CUGBP Elav-like family member 5 [Chlorella sorokiniana]|uniref:CUGBP Elav-like family member 5 n=1 Tax=Chlorella sorokiniana TaxID=3076 RepID=A0A2P6TXY7_CHLSO|nr:CUGBP Elav-like family member 5 [Chlorella sorokiniana]|eukprot:PRW58932.1 CUGBP Elav-like family member 5 [Chlorella sorokiniana]
MASPEAASPVSEEDSWAGLSPAPAGHPIPAEASTCSLEGSSPAKLFIFNLARSPLFERFNPLYATVAVGKKGTSRRFGFAKFTSPSAAQAALEALRGTQLHGKELDLKFAVALEEPDPASGVQAKLRARLRHLLVVQHGTGTSHDSVMQKVWCFRPINVSTTPDANGGMKREGAADGSGAPPVVMQPVMHSIFSNIEAALAGRSFVPAWDRLHQEAPKPGQPLVLAEALQYDSGTEDEGEFEPDPREVYAAVSPDNLNTLFVIRTLMRRLAPVELLLKQTAVGGQEAAPSVLEGAVVRVLIDKAYKLRQVQSTYIKPESQRLMLVLHDVSSPIPADHISNTNPLLGSGPLPAAAEAELLELHSKLAFHGRRLFRHEVAATAWRLQFADHWQGHEAGGRSGDELRLAVANLRAMLGDEDEIRWRRRGVQGLDLAQEAAAVAAAFHLPHNSAANWMGSPQALAVATYPGGSPSSAEHSNVTGDYQSRPPLSQHEVLGLQRSSHLLPSRAAARSLVRAASDPARHDSLMASFYAGQHPQQEPAQHGAGSDANTAPASLTAAASAPRSASAHSRGNSASLEGLQAGGSSGSSSKQDEEEADANRLLAEAATFGADDADTGGLPAFFSGLKLEPAGGPSAHTSKQPGGSENGRGHGNPSAQPQPSRPTTSKGAGILLAALERRGSGLIAAVRAVQAKQPCAQ